MTEDKEKQLLDMKSKLLKSMNALNELSSMGSLGIFKNKGFISYYLVKVENGSKKQIRKYLKKSDLALIKALAQYAYNKKLLRLIDNLLNQEKRASREYTFEDIDQLYLSLSKERRELVTPIRKPWPMLLDAWKKRPYNPNSLNPENLKFQTLNKELVRSKIEKILADKFFFYKIPYKYECPLQLAPRYTIYPDFTFLSPKTRKEVYWEHFGMMDNPDYALDAFRKIESYSRFGIKLGQNLIVTFESNSYKVTDDYIETLIRDFLI